MASQEGAWGRLSFESVDFELSRHTARWVATARYRESGSPSAMNSTVCIIDDDKFVRRFAMDVIESMGHHPLGFLSAEEFLDASVNARPCCLILDLELDGMSGIDLQEVLIQKGQRIPIIAYSGRANVATAVSLMESGAITLLEKPCSVSDLMGAIEQAIAADVRRLEEEDSLQDIAKSEQSLLPRERVVLQCIISGKLNKVIARELDVSERTIEGDRAKIYKKFRVDSAAEVAVKSTQLQWLRAQQGKTFQ